VLAYAAQTFVYVLIALLYSNVFACSCVDFYPACCRTGGFAYWGVQYVKKALHYSDGKAGASMCSELHSRVE